MSKERNKWVVINRETGKPMKRFKTKKDAEAYRKTLRNPKIHQSVGLPSYNFTHDSAFVVDGNIVNANPFSTTNINPIITPTMPGGIGGDLGIPPSVDPGGGGILPPATPPPTPTPPPSYTPPVGGGGATVGGEDATGGTVTIPNPGTGYNPTLPDRPLPDSYRPDDNTSASTPDTAGEIREVMDETDESWAEWAEDNALLLGAGAVGLAGVGFDLTREEDSLIRRVFNRSKELADSVWLEYVDLFPTEGSKRADMRELLRRDFAREGPLYLAHQKGELAANLSRSNWTAFDRDYNERNFPPKKFPGFARLDTKVEAYLYDPISGDVITKEEFSNLITTGRFARPTKFKKGRKNGFTVINQRGDKVNFIVAKPNEFIDELNNTPKNAYDGLDFEEQAESDPDSEVIAIRKEREKLERQLKELESTLGRTMSSSLSPLEIIAQEEERAKRQLEADERAKKRIEEAAEKKQKEMAKKAADEQRKLENLVASAGDLVSDTQVSKERYELDKQWVQRYVSSGLGGVIPSDAIKDAKYEYEKGGSVLKIEYTPEFAVSRGYPEGFATEKWSRNRLIELNAIPQQYGPGFTPLWFTTSGRASPSRPSWATSSKMNPTLKSFSRKLPRSYFRNISGQKYLGSTNGVSKAKAISSARNIRRLGRNARVIPSSKGYRVYVGGSRKR